MIIDLSSVSILSLNSPYSDSPPQIGLNYPPGNHLVSSFLYFTQPILNPLGIDPNQSVLLQVLLHDPAYIFIRAG
jgi:hypothetical protein